MLFAFRARSVLMFLRNTRHHRSKRVIALEAFKLAIYEDPYSVLSNWNFPNNDCCNWFGITCSSSDNRVIALNLSGLSLKGCIVPELGLLSSLQTLVLANNSFVGPIPSQIGMLKSLISIDLSTNQIVGPIPPTIGDLSSIQYIDLHSNELGGNVSVEFGNLGSLVGIWLNDNELNGQIPGTENSDSSSAVSGTVNQKNSTGFCLLHNLQVIDLSDNFFTGDIPLCLKRFQRTSFQENCLNTDSIAQRSTQMCNSSESQGATKKLNGVDSNLSEHRKSKQPKWLLILEISTGAVLAIFLVTCMIIGARNCMPKPLVINPAKKSSSFKGHISISIDGEFLSNVPRFSREELEIACEDFSNIIGSSLDCKVYKGNMKGGSEIAVVSVCIPEGQWSTHLELYFQKEVADFARLNHHNTAKLLGYCVESLPFSRMLVFEYPPNGTLYEHLHYGEGSQYSWFRRMKVAIGIARGLRYLHTELQPPFTLSELHSSSVYLTEDFSPKLVDFERWKAVIARSETNSGYFTNSVSFNSFEESPGRRHVDVQENTYAFGLLLLELISGRPSHCKTRGSLVDWARTYLQNPEKSKELIDPGVEGAKEDQLSVVCGVVSLCVDPEASRRPSMQILAAMLEDGIDISAAAIVKESRLSWGELAFT